MDCLTRLVSESLARHGFDRPLDYRRLHWSRWFRCESHHSLLLVPSQPGVFALAEEIMDLGPAQTPTSRVWDRVSDPVRQSAARLDIAASTTAPARRMLAVSQFFEDDDMAFVLDRMLARHHPMHDRLISGRYFVRFVVIEEESQRRSICNALNQWIANSSEQASTIGSHFATSLELTPATEYVAPANEAQATLFEETPDVAQAPSPATADAAIPSLQAGEAVIRPTGSFATAPQLDSGAAANIHCPFPFPSGF
jgi:hypothetical protein